MPHQGFDWRRVAASELIHVGPADFGGLLLAAGGGGTADVTVYDGRDAGARQFTTFRTPGSRTESHGPPVPAFFDQGIFVGLGANVEECVVLYCPVEP